MSESQSPVSECQCSGLGFVYPLGFDEFWIDEFKGGLEDGHSDLKRVSLLFVEESYSATA